MVTVTPSRKFFDKPSIATAKRFDNSKAERSNCKQCCVVPFCYECNHSKQGPCMYKGPNSHAKLNFAVFICLLGRSPKPCDHHDTVMAAHSCGVLKERFAKREACIGTMQFKGLGFPNKHFATQKRFCINKTIACHGCVLAESGHETFYLHCKPGDGFG